MKSNYIESFVVASAVVLAAGCSAAELSEDADQDSAISSLEQAIGEASCATATPNAAATLTFANSEAFLSPSTPDVAPMA